MLWGAAEGHWTPQPSPVVGAGCSPELVGGVKSLSTPQQLQVKFNPSQVLGSHQGGPDIWQAVVLHDKQPWGEDKDLFCCLCCQSGAACDPPALCPCQDHCPHL